MLDFCIKLLVDQSLKFHCVCNGVVINNDWIYLGVELAKLEYVYSELEKLISKGVVMSLDNVSESTDPLPGFGCLAFRLVSNDDFVSEISLIE